MTDFSALSLGSSEELEALLLSSADDDGPADGSLERVGLALGLGASALAVAAASSTVATTTAVAGQGATLAQHLGLASLAKWLGVGIAAGVVSAGAAHFAARPVTPPAEPAVAAPAPEHARLAKQARTPGNAELPAEVPLPPEQEPAAAPLAAQGAVTPPGAALPHAALAAPNLASPPSAAAPLPTAPVAEAPALPSSASFAPDEPAPAASVAATSVAAPPPSTLGDETKALDRVRSHLAAGRTTQALAEIQRYRAQWPSGALGAEAAILRVDALLRSGNRAEADREAEVLIKRAPQSRYAARARALLGYKPE